MKSFEFMDILSVCVCVLSIAAAAINLNISAIFGWSFALAFFLRCRKLERAVNWRMRQDRNVPAARESKRGGQFYSDPDWWKNQ